MGHCTRKNTILSKMVILSGRFFKKLFTLESLKFVQIIRLSTGRLFTLLNIDENTSTTLTSGVIVFIAFLLTCLGVFDKLSNIAYLGVIIPISGFANSITSSALEGKSEGLIFGIGSKIFSLIGSVISIGIVSSIAFGFIYYLIKVIA